METITIKKPAYSLKNFYTFIKRANLQVKPHQEQGIKWTLQREIKGVNVNGTIIKGGLIADEMGLGKTILVIGTMLCNLQKSTLIVLPLVLLQQWNNIIQKMIGHTPIVYHGIAKKDITLQQLKKAPIVLTTYGMINERYVNSGLIHQVKWNRVIYDEAHHIRNKTTTSFTGAAKLKTDITWLVTGTPIQNSIKDFFTMCSIIKIPEQYYADSENVKNIVKLFVLKRTKRQVGIVLPELKNHDIVVPWKSENERKVAQGIHEQLSFSGVKTTETPFNNNLYPIQRIMLARQICVMPSMIIPKIIGQVKKGQIHKKHFEILEGLKHSSKIDAVVDTIVQRKDNLRNKIVFCQFTQEIDEIMKRLRQNDINVVVYDGRTPYNQRNDILTGDAQVLLLQIQTACEGLNLQHFSEIYFVAPHWNPAVEDQAVARCYRIGQENDVDVFRFNMQNKEKFNDVENHCKTIQNKKRLLFKIID